MPEPGLVIELREEMFNDTRYGAEVFYMHVRGVDSLMLLSYAHIFKKIFLKKLCYKRIRRLNSRWLRFCSIPRYYILRYHA